MTLPLAKNLSELPEYRGVLLTLVDQRTAHSREVVRVVRASLAGQVNVFETEVRLHVALKETAKVGRSILEFEPNSPSAEAYRGLAREVLGVLGDSASPRAAQPARLLDLPALVEARPAVAAIAEAPKFESFVREGWQRWLGSAS